MKLALTMFVLLVTFAQPCEARTRKKPPKAGTIEESTYVDKTFGFSMTLPDGWKPKVQPDKDECRLVLEQVEYTMSSRMESARDSWSPPTARVWILDLPFTANEFIDSLLSDTYNSETMSWVLNDLLEPGARLEVQEINTVGRNTIRVDACSVAAWRGLAKYMFVNVPAKGTRFAAACFAVKRGEHLLVVFVKGFEMSFDTTLADCQKMVESLKWE